MPPSENLPTTSAIPPLRRAPRPPRRPHYLPYALPRRMGLKRSLTSDQNAEISTAPSPAKCR